MNLCIIITSVDPELIFNGFRLANHSLGKSDEVEIFLMAKAVEVESIQDERFDLKDQIRKFLLAGGKVSACGNCLQLRRLGPSEMFQTGNLDGLYETIKRSDKTITL